MKSLIIISALFVFFAAYFGCGCCDYLVSEPGFLKGQVGGCFNQVDMSFLFYKKKKIL